MGRKREITKEDIESGYLTCKKCKEKRELIFFYKKKYNYSGVDEVTYQISKCKVCKSKTGSYKVKDIEVLDISRFHLSKEARLFIRRIILLKGKIGVIDAYKLVHYHLETFDYIERQFDSVEQELSIMYKELLKVYDKDQETRL